MANLIRQYIVTDIAVTGTWDSPQTIAYADLIDANGSSIPTTFDVYPGVKIISKNLDVGVDLTEAPGLSSFKIAKSGYGDIFSPLTVSIEITASLPATAEPEAGDAGWTLAEMMSMFSILVGDIDKNEFAPALKLRILNAAMYRVIKALKPPILKELYVKQTALALTADAEYDLDGLTYEILDGVTGIDRVQITDGEIARKISAEEYWELLKKDFEFDVDEPLYTIQMNKLTLLAGDDSDEETIEITYRRKPAQMALAAAALSAPMDSSNINKYIYSPDSVWAFMPFNDARGDIWHGNRTLTETNVTYFQNYDSLGGSASFNGSSSLATLAGITDSTKGITIEFTMYVRTMVANNHIVNQANFSTGKGWSILLDNSGLFVYQGTALGFSNYYATSYPVTLKTKYDVQVVFYSNGTRPLTYVNGKKATATADVGAPLTALDIYGSTIYIGRRIDNADSYYNGLIKNLIITHREKSVDELMRGYAARNDNKFGTMVVDSLNTRVGRFTSHVWMDSTLTVTGSARADTFITTSEKAISKEAVERVKQIKFKAGTEHGNYAELDHSSLPADMQVTIKERYYKDKVTGEEYHRKNIWKTVAGRLVDDTQIMDSVTGKDTITVVREAVTGKIYSSPQDYLERRFKIIEKEDIGLNLNRYIFELGRAMELINARQDSIVNAMK